MGEDMKIDSIESTKASTAENKIVKGKPKSGRVWKEPRTR